MTNKINLNSINEVINSLYEIEKEQDEEGEQKNVNSEKDEDIKSFKMKIYLKKVKDLLIIMKYFLK